MLHQHQPHLRVLFMSGVPRTNLSEFQSVPHQEGFRFLQKPFGINELLRLVEHFFAPVGASIDSAVLD